jgi:hypothetical protein
VEPVTQNSSRGEHAFKWNIAEHSMPNLHADMPAAPTKEVISSETQKNSGKETAMVLCSHAAALKDQLHGLRACVHSARADAHETILAARNEFERRCEQLINAIALVDEPRLPRLAAFNPELDPAYQTLRRTLGEQGQRLQEQHALVESLETKCRAYEQEISNANDELERERQNSAADRSLVAQDIDMRTKQELCASVKVLSTEVRDLELVAAFGSTAIDALVLDQSLHEAETCITSQVETIVMTQKATAAAVSAAAEAESERAKGEDMLAEIRARASAAEASATEAARRYNTFLEGAARRFIQSATPRREGARGRGGDGTGDTAATPLNQRRDPASGVGDTHEHIEGGNEPPLDAAIAARLEKALRDQVSPTSTIAAKASRAARMEAAYVPHAAIPAQDTLEILETLERMQTPADRAAARVTSTCSHSPHAFEHSFLAQYIEQSAARKKPGAKPASSWCAVPELPCTPALPLLHKPVPPNGGRIGTGFAAANQMGATLLPRPPASPTRPQADLDVSSVQSSRSRWANRADSPVTVPLPSPPGEGILRKAALPRVVKPNAILDAVVPPSARTRKRRAFDFIYSQRATTTPAIAPPRPDSPFFAPATTLAETATRRQRGFAATSPRTASPRIR